MVASPEVAARVHGQLCLKDVAFYRYASLRGFPTNVVRLILLSWLLWGGFTYLINPIVGFDRAPDWVPAIILLGCCMQPVWAVTVVAVWRWNVGRQMSRARACRCLRCGYAGFGEPTLGCGFRVAECPECGELFIAVDGV
ncbi:MAG: hypothetical protein KDB18_10840 [Salinibacterium sp.]|nr:hypothetical protein [Salinibacterium sp.]